MCFLYIFNLFWNCNRVGLTPKPPYLCLTFGITKDDKLLQPLNAQRSIDVISSEKEIELSFEQPQKEPANSCNIVWVVIEVKLLLPKRLLPIDVSVWLLSSQITTSRKGTVTNCCYVARIIDLTSENPLKK